MKKFYLVPPLVTGLAFVLSYIEPIISIGLFFLLPIGTYWYLHRNEADIFLESSDIRERICMIALSNRQMVPFIAEKVNEDWLKIEDKFIEMGDNDEYIYKGKIITFVLQDEDMEVSEILEMKEKINPGFLSRRVFFSNSFLQSIAFPIAGVALLSLPFIPITFPWILLLFGPMYMDYKIWSSGALEFAGGQGGGEITVLYIRGSRKVKPTTAEAVGEDWFTYQDGLGNVKTVNGTDYYFHGTRVYLSGAGIPTTFSLEHAEKANWFRKIGLRDWKEFDKAMDMIDNHDDYKKYESLEDAYEEKEQEFVKDIRKELKKEEVTPVAK